MFVAISVAVASLAAQDASLSSNQYRMDGVMQRPSGAPVWRDEFNGKALDKSKWSFDTSRNAQGWHNKELQYYSADRKQNLRFEKGRLIIEARNDPQGIRGNKDYGKQQYSSAAPTTHW